MCPVVEKFAQVGSKFCKNIKFTLKNAKGF